MWRASKFVVLAGRNAITFVSVYLGDIQMYLCLKM